MFIKPKSEVNHIMAPAVLLSVLVLVGICQNPDLVFG